MGRPKKNFDWSKLDAILQFHSPLIDAADIVGVSVKTLQRRIREEYDMTFDEYRYQKGSRTRQNLRQIQYDTAKNGNVTMQIWLGKQWLGQSDKKDINMSGEVDIHSKLMELKEKLKFDEPD